MSEINEGLQETREPFSGEPPGSVEIRHSVLLETRKILFDPEDDEKNYTSVDLSDPGNGGTVKIDGSRSIYTDKEVYLATGHNLGELAAVIILPRANGAIEQSESDARRNDATVYCFRASGGQHAIPEYTFASKRYLDELGEQDELDSERMTTLRGEDGRVSLGRSLLTGSANKVDKSYVPIFRRGERFVSRSQLFAEVRDGSLVLGLDPAAKNRNVSVSYGLPEKPL